MTMIAIVLEVNRNNLRVRDILNNQEVVVVYNRTHRFSVGDRILIRYRNTVTTKYNISPHNKKACTFKVFMWAFLHFRIINSKKPYILCE